MKVIVKFKTSREFIAYQILRGVKHPFGGGVYIGWKFFGFKSTVYKILESFGGGFNSIIGYDLENCETPVFVQIDVEKNKIKYIKESNDFIYYDDFILLKSVSK